MMSFQALSGALPILMLIGVGVLVRLSGLIDERSGLILTRLAYHVTIPAAIFTSIARAPLTTGMLMLPVIGFLLPTLLAALIYLTTRRLADRPRQRGVMLVSTVVLGVFGYPFFDLFFGAPGLARIAMFDVGNAIFAGTIALWMAQSFGSRVQCGCGDRVPGSAPWRKVLTSPVLLASILGVAASATGLKLGGPVGNLLDRLTAANTPLAMIAVGVFLRPRRLYASLLGQVVGVRMLLGIVLGWVIACLAGMHGLDLVVACSASALPTGTTALIYAGNEGLDPEFAAAIISLTVLLSMILINILPLWLGSVYP
jgi:predicted permease